MQVHHSLLSDFIPVLLHKIPSVEVASKALANCVDHQRKFLSLNLTPIKTFLQNPKRENQIKFRYACADSSKDFPSDRTCCSALPYDFPYILSASQSFQCLVLLWVIDGVFIHVQKLTPSFICLSSNFEDCSHEITGNPKTTRHVSQVVPLFSRITVQKPRALDNSSFLLLFANHKIKREIIQPRVNHHTDLLRSLVGSEPLIKQMLCLCCAVTYVKRTCHLQQGRPKRHL